MGKPPIENAPLPSKLVQCRPWDSVGSNSPRRQDSSQAIERASIRSRALRQFSCPEALGYPEPFGDYRPGVPDEKAVQCPQLCPSRADESTTGSAQRCDAATPTTVALPTASWSSSRWASHMRATAARAKEQASPAILAAASLRSTRGDGLRRPTLANGARIAGHDLGRAGCCVCLGGVVVACHGEVRRQFEQAHRLVAVEAAPRQLRPG